MMAPRPFEVIFLGGRPALVLMDADTLTELAEMVDRANRQAIYKGGLPVPAAAPFVSAARHVAALIALVPTAEPLCDALPDGDGHWISTGEAARLLGITDRAVRKRIEHHKLPARQLAGCWWIDAKEITDAVA